MDRYPKTNDGQVLESISLWFSLLLILLTLTYVIIELAGHGKKHQK